MDTSVFSDKNTIPGDSDLVTSLGKTFPLWMEIKDYAYSRYPAAIAEWNYPGEKYGWSFRIKDKKRAIIYLLPRDGFFKVAFVFGQKATDAIIQSRIADAIITELESAKVYTEGRGIRIDIRDNELIKDIKLLIDIKVAS